MRLGIRTLPRVTTLVVLMAMTGFAAVGFLTIRRDVAGLQSISRDGALWSAAQLEVELLRFHTALVELGEARSDEALCRVREQFDLLWSRVFMMLSGENGDSLGLYASGRDTIRDLAADLERIDPSITALEPGDVAVVHALLQDLVPLEEALRLHTLGVVRADADASAALRGRIQTSALSTAILSSVALLVSALSLFLILRENRRQRDLVAMTRKVAQEAEQSSRAKSRFLAMMSHELRNPLNGILGPLALLEQSGVSERQARLIEKARQCGGAMLQMLMALLDYAEIQDGRLQLRRDSVRLDRLASAIEEALATRGVEVRVHIAPGSPDAIEGDLDRLRQIFVSLVEFVLELRAPENVRVDLSHAAGHLLGVIGFTAGDAARDWKLDLLVGLAEAPDDQMSGDALRPLIARGLIGASRGSLSLGDGDGGLRTIVVRLPSAVRGGERIRVHLETRSAALATIYRASLRSERIEFAEAGQPVDVVLVDSTTIDEEPLMERLRGRHPRALFVSLGHPQHPTYFDDVVASPRDMGGLRRSILSRLAS